MTQLQRLIQTYDNIMSLKDPRVENWLFVQTPFEPILILVAYGLFIYFGQKIMSKRQAFELRTFLYFYNFIQVVISFYIFYEILVTAIQSKYSLVCQPVDYSDNPLSLRMARVLWMYYLTKILDLIDTVVFVLRKKQNQITFLHLFHHISMVCNGWSGVRFVPGGQTFFLAVLNSFVHTVMYGYYGLSACGPKIQKFLWWKRYITQLQLAQFFILLAHTLVNYFSECSYPKGWNIAFFIYVAFITLLFLNFYRESYKKKSKEKMAIKKESSGEPNGIHNDKKHNE